MTKQYNTTLAAIILIFLVALEAAAWWNIFSAAGSRAARAYFLDVGEGDAALTIFPGNVKVMTDAGPDDRVVAAMEKIMPPDDDYIDLAVITYPSADDFGGYFYLIDHYRVGAFIWNGRAAAAADAAPWAALMEKIRAAHIPVITLAGGDGIRYKDNAIDMIAPGPGFLESADVRDTALVALIKTAGFRALFAADIGGDAENDIIARATDIRADILKVARHGSDASSGAAFLKAVNPSVAVIDAGAKNKKGYPDAAVLARIASSTNAAVRRTDLNGTISIAAGKGGLKIATER